MPEPVAAALWGLAAASSLALGSIGGVTLPIPRSIVALVMAFGAGALISALSFDLAEEAFKAGGTFVTGAGLAAGATAYFVGAVLLDRRARRAGEKEGGGLAIALGAFLDGVPESIVLGASLLGGATVSASLLAAVFLSNAPEGFAGSRDLVEEGHRPRRVVALWVGVAVASGLAAGVGNALLTGADPGIVAAAQAFAGGAILTMLADTMFPEAFEHGGDAVGLTTVLGFAVAFLLSRVR